MGKVTRCGTILFALTCFFLVSCKAKSQFQAQIPTMDKLWRLTRAIERYQMTMGFYPRDDRWILDLDTVDSPYAVRRRQVDDPNYIDPTYYDQWGVLIVYQRISDNAYILYSKGQNGIDEGGLGDDVGMNEGDWTRFMYQRGYGSHNRREFVRRSVEQEIRKDGGR